MALSSGLPVSRIVFKQVSLTTPAVTAPAINSCLFLGTAAVIDPIERMREFADITEVEGAFGSASEEYRAADLWFAQSPSPENLFIGRWVRDPSPGQLMGAPLPPADQSMGRWAAVADGAFQVTLDGGTAQQIGGLDFTGMTNLNAVAAAITTALAAQAGMVWNAAAARFELTSTTTGPTSGVSFLTPSGSGTDISDMLAMRAESSGAYAVPGMAAETALAAAVAIDAQFSSQWYALVCPSADDNDHLQLAAFCEAAEPAHYYGLTTAEAGALVATVTTDIGNVLADFGYNKTAPQFSTSSPYAIMSYLARILTTQWTGQNTTITLKFKQQPGVAAENISTDQADTLARKNYNVFTVYANGARMIQEGVSSSGEFTDTVIGADALAGDIQADLFNVLYSSPTKVPQTDPGMQLLLNATLGRCAIYAGNGWLGAGIWNAQGFGTLNYGDFMPLGYYAFAPSMLLQTEAARAARDAPLITVAAKTAGAIHRASVLIYVNQ